MADLTPNATSTVSAQEKLGRVKIVLDSVDKEVDKMSSNISKASSGLQEKLQGLRQAVDSLSVDVNALTQCREGNTWTSVPITSVGATALKSQGTSAFEIPSVIPSTAKNVLVYATFYTGCADKDDPSQHLKVFTQDGSNRRYEKYLFMHTYPQSAYNTNSENMWFPMPANRMVYLTLTTVPGLNCKAMLFVTGYN